MMPLSVPYQNAKLTIYPAWRVWLVHLVAKPLGVLVHVNGYPFGSNRISRRFPGCFTRKDVIATIERARHRDANVSSREPQE